MEAERISSRDHAPANGGVRERNAEIIRRLRAGESFGVVAEALGVTRNVVAGVNNRAGGLGHRAPLTHRPRYRGGCPPKMRGENHPFAKLTDAQVAALREERAAGVKLRVLAAKYGIRLAYVWALASGRVRPALAA